MQREAAQFLFTILMLAGTGVLAAEPASDGQREDACNGGVTVPVAQPPARLCVRPGSGQVFRDCHDCPEMVVVPAGSFTMGAPRSERMHQDNEAPRHTVTITRPFAVGRFAVTFAEWDACAENGGCGGEKPGDNDWGRDSRPVINVSWDDANAYVTWLSQKTGKSYRLLSEAEREYVTRAGTDTPFWWGSQASTDRANYNGGWVYDGGVKGEFRRKTLPVQSLTPNPWGLYQVHGNVWEWTEDCWNRNYDGAPTDGSAWTAGTCVQRVLRGGSWDLSPVNMRSACRYSYSSFIHLNIVGFRVARILNP